MGLCLLLYQTKNICWMRARESERDMKEKRSNHERQDEVCKLIADLHINEHRKFMIMFIAFICMRIRISICLHLHVNVKIFEVLDEDDDDTVCYSSSCHNATVVY